MVSIEFWKKQARVSFSKTIKFARETTILLLINNIKNYAVTPRNS
jgi:hypothetical protein